MLKYGFSSFSIKPLIETQVDHLDDLEREFIIKHDSISTGYNLREGGDRSQHSEETKVVISQRTKESIARNIDRYRSYDTSKGLPVHCIRVNIKGSEGVAVNNHPNCKRKSFTVRKYGSIENATSEMLKFYDSLDSPHVNAKAGSHLPSGVRKIKNGYAVQKIINKQLYYKAFTRSSEEENKQLALDYLSQLPQMIAQGCSSTTKCQSGERDVRLKI